MFLLPHHLIILSFSYHLGPWSLIIKKCPRLFLSTPVLMHDGFLYLAFFLSVTRPKVRLDKPNHFRVICMALYEPSFWTSASS